MIKEFEDLVDLSDAELLRVLAEQDAAVRAMEETRKAISKSRTSVERIMKDRAQQAINDKLGADLAPRITFYISSANLPRVDVSVELKVNNG